MSSPATPPEPRVCPRCGATHGADQEYCLECGYRLRPPSGVFGRLSSACQARFGWYPGDWVWRVLLGFIIAGWVLLMFVWSYLMNVASLVYKGALFLYASEGIVCDPYDQDMLNSAWKYKK